jgi:hypothetical protein
MKTKRSKSWNKEECTLAIKNSLSIRQVLTKLKLVPAGGNYEQVKRFIKENKVDISHFTGKGWRKGSLVPTVKSVALNQLLVKESLVQSFKLKKRLFKEGLKHPACEECGWAKMSQDGRIPLELDHINGNKYDNRLANLRILCPNCHSLQPTHRGRNKKTPGWCNGSHERLKISWS